MEKYNLKQMAQDLKELAEQLKPYEIAEIAAVEKCGTPTVNNYMRGAISFPAVGAAFIVEAKRIIENREKDV